MTRMDIVATKAESMKTEENIRKHWIIGVCSTAINMFGPFHIKLNQKTLNEAQVVIFTCMTTRAVHLELVNDKTSDAFL